MIQAVRQTQVAPQVAGRITALTVRAGDRVSAGQVLARIDERAADQQSQASRALVAAAQAELEAARRELERSRRLFARQYISQAAMDEAEARFKVAEARSLASSANAGVAGTSALLHTIVAPYAGVVASVAVELGDSAMPGKPLLTLFDPGALRVEAIVPEGASGGLHDGAGSIRVDIPAAPEASRNPSAGPLQVLPTADPASHTLVVRLGLPAKLAGVIPGMYARVLLPAADADRASVLVPAAAVFRRSEMYAVYVLDSGGRPRLRQVRPGGTAGGRTRVLAGLEPGEQVLLDPLSAERQAP